VKKLHIAVDLDDVVLDFMPSVMKAFELEYDVKPEYDGTTWGRNAVVFGNHPMFKESGYQSWWGWLRDRAWLWATFPAIPGAIGGIKRLRAAGHYVECVTSKPEWAEYNVWKWLGRWRPAFNRVTIVSNGQAKIDYTDADVIVDDKLETCQSFVAMGRTAIWFNRGPKDTPSVGVDRMAWDWEGVIEHIREVSEYVDSGSGSGARGDGTVPPGFEWETRGRGYDPS